MTCITRKKNLSKKSIDLMNSMMVFNSARDEKKEKLGNMIKEDIKKRLSDSTLPLNVLTVDNYQEYFMHNYGIAVLAIKNSNMLPSAFITKKIQVINFGNDYYNQIDASIDSEKFMNDYKTKMDAEKISYSDEEKIFLMKILQSLNNTMSLAIEHNIDIDRLKSAFIIHTDINFSPLDIMGYFYPMANVTEFQFGKESDPRKQEVIFMHESIHDFTMENSRTNFSMFPYDFNQDLFNILTHNGADLGYVHIENIDQNKMRDSKEHYVQTSKNGWFFDLDSDANKKRKHPFVKEDINVLTMENPSEYMVYPMAETIVELMHGEKSEFYKKAVFTKVYKYIIKYISKNNKVDRRMNVVYNDSE